MVPNMHRLLLRERRKNRSNSDFQTFFEEFTLNTPLKQRDVRGCYGVYLATIQ